MLDPDWVFRQVNQLVHLLFAWRLLPIAPYSGLCSLNHGAIPHPLEDRNLAALRIFSLRGESQPVLVWDDIDKNTGLHIYLPQVAVL